MFIFMKAIRRKGDFRLGIGFLMGFKAWLRHPILARIPITLVTPQDTPEAGRRKINAIPRLAGQSTGHP